jgi:hypothetical protein
MLDLLDRPIAYHRALAKIAGSVAGGVFLSQAVYWSGRMGWREFYKTAEEWHEETMLTRYEMEAARKTLKAAGILKERLSGLPARLYFRIDRSALEGRISQIVVSSKLVCSDPANLFDQIQQTNTETTTEITTQDPPIPPKGEERVKIHPSWTDDGSGKVTMVDAIEAFESYWSLYPRKTNKSGARVKFIAMLRKGTEHEAFDRGFDAYLRYCGERNEPQFVAHFSTWLHQERWNDEHPEESKGNGRHARSHALPRAANMER